jgi:hypothetical protein
MRSGRAVGKPGGLSLCLSVIAPFEPTRFSRILHSDSRQLGFVDVAGRTYRLMRVVVRHLELHHHSKGAITERTGAAGIGVGLSAGMRAATKVGHSMQHAVRVGARQQELGS